MMTLVVGPPLSEAKKLHFWIQFCNEFKQEDDCSVFHFFLMPMFLFKKIVDFVFLKKKGMDNFYVNQQTTLTARNQRLPLQKLSLPVLVRYTKTSQDCSPTGDSGNIRGNFGCRSPLLQPKKSFFIFFWMWLQYCKPFYLLDCSSFGSMLTDMIPEPNQ